MGFPALRGRSPSTVTADGDRGTVRGPVFASTSVNSRASRSTFCHCKLRISLFRHPVSMTSRIAAMAPWGALGSVSNLSSTPSYDHDT